MKGHHYHALRITSVFYTRQGVSEMRIELAQYF
jgi:hypothetical protein